MKQSLSPGILHVIVSIEIELNVGRQSSYPLKIYDIFTKLDEYFRTFSKLDCQKYPDVAIYAHPVLNPATTI